MILLLLFASLAHADLASSLERLRPAFLAAGGQAKSLDQLQCFVRRHQTKTFRTPKFGGELKERCTGERIRLENEHAALIIDYTQLSNRARFFLFDLREGKLLPLFTSHGRYGETPRDNTVSSDNPKRNSVLRARHFSNAVGSNATAGGFYLTGIEYQGTYGRSLVLHGLEQGFNHNSCERMTVIHRSSAITDSATNLMSSGCPMVALHRIDPVVEALREGALAYFYTPAEAALAADRCGRNLLE